MQKKVICKVKIFHILLAISLITTTLLIVVSIYFFIEYQVKQKHLLLFHETNIKFKKFDINNVLQSIESSDE